MRIEISREEVLLDTGGGLKKAAWFFSENSAIRTSRLFCTTSMCSAPSIWTAWCNFTGRSRRWPRWRCRSGRRRDICCSTRRICFAAAVLGTIGSHEIVRSSVPAFRTDAGAGIFRRACDFSAAARENCGRRCFLDHHFLSAAGWRGRKDCRVSGGRILLARSGQAGKRDASGERREAGNPSAIVKTSVVKKQKPQAPDFPLAPRLWLRYHLNTSW